MLVGAIRRAPPVVSAFLLLTTVTFVVGLARSPNLWHHPGSAAVVVVVLVLWVAAIVVWRQRWAWLLMLLVAVAAVVSPAWGEWNGSFAYVDNIATLALLISPGMLRWVGVGKGRQRHQAAST